MVAEQQGNNAWTVPEESSAWGRRIFNDEEIDGEEEAECDEEWTEHLPLSGKGEVMDKDAAADKAVTTEVAKSIDLFK